MAGITIEMVLQPKDLEVLKTALQAHRNKRIANDLLGIIKRQEGMQNGKNENP